MSAGDAAYKSKDYQSALADYRQAASLATGPDQAKALYHEGLAYHKLHEDSQAVAAYQQAQSADPSLSFASSPDKFAHNLQIAQKDAGATASSPQGSTAPAARAATGSTDPASIALANGDVYVSPSLINQVNQTRLTEAAEADEQTAIKIAVLDRLPPGDDSTAAYAHRLHDYLNLGNGGLIVVAVHGAGAGVADVAGQLSADKERQIAQKYVAQLGSGDYTNALAAMSGDLASAATSRYFEPMETLLIVALIVVVVIVFLVLGASRRKKAQITALRVPLESDRDKVIAGIESLDKFIDVLPKNNADSDQVRAFRQSAAYKVEQAEKIMARSTEVTDMNRAQSLMDQAAGDVANAKKYLDRATGGTGIDTNEGPVVPIPFPTSQHQVNQVPEEQRGVSFFSSQPAPVSQLMPVTLNIDGQNKTVMATPLEADMIRRGQMPPVRSFNVGGQSIPWYAYEHYDPYNDYWTYQNNGWRGVAGGAIAGFIGAEMMNSLFAPRPYWGGGWNSPYAYGPGWDSWGGWDNYGGNYDQGFLQGEQAARAQDFAFNDRFTAPDRDPNYDGGASFMNSGGGYDTSDYGGGGGGASFMGGDRS
jgi:tetratricopeptide (TPR) repeat protein